jgi:KDO2-lipid IV(A) lauroyltransferase
MLFLHFPDTMGRDRNLKKDIKYGAIVLLINLVLFAIRILPVRWSHAVCARLGVWAYYLLKKERTKTHNNLRIAYADRKTDVEVRQMAVEIFKNLGRSAAELAAKLREDDRDRFFRNMDISGEEHLRAALERGKGIINIVPHLGCWEALAKIFSMLNIPAGAVGKPLSNPRLNAFVMRERQRMNFTILPRGSSYSAILKFVKDNHALGMLIDQDTNVKGVFVDFYGKPAYTPIGAAMLALDTDAVVLTTSYVYAGSGRYPLIIGAPMEITRTGDKERDLHDNTRRFHAEVEQLIQAYPTQWVWMHERWKTTPELLRKREEERLEARKRRREAARQSAGT